MELTNVKSMLLAFITMFVLCAPASEICHASDLQAVVSPVRVIQINYMGEIVSISSNTSQSLTPHVERIGAPGIPVKYTAALKSKYLQIIKKYDFSKPIEVRIKELSPVDKITNFIINNIRSIFL